MVNLRRDGGPGIATIPLQGQFSKTGWWRREAMRTFTVAAVMLALLAMPAHAQARRPQAEQKKTDTKKLEVDEGAYKAALERIPEPKEKYDPWGVARPAEPAKKSK
jgi:hypothetical protein